MAKYCGKDFLVQRGDGASPEVFTTIVAGRSLGLTINNESVDVTTKGEVPWRQLIACGIKSMSITVAGVITGDAVLKSMETDANGTSNTIHNFKIISGRGDTYMGAFLVASFGRTGEYNGAEQYSITLESAGAITYTAAP